MNECFAEWWYCHSQGHLSCYLNSGILYNGDITINKLRQECSINSMTLYITQVSGSPSFVLGHQSTREREREYRKSFLACCNCMVLSSCTLVYIATSDGALYVQIIYPQAQSSLIIWLFTSTPQCHQIFCLIILWWETSLALTILTYIKTGWWNTTLDCKLQWPPEGGWNPPSSMGKS